MSGRLGGLKSVKNGLRKNESHDWVCPVILGLVVGSVILARTGAQQIRYESVVA